MDEHYDEQNLDQKSGYCVSVSTDSKVCPKTLNGRSFAIKSLAKGQLISEWIFGVFKPPKKASQDFGKISGLVS